MDKRIKKTRKTIFEVFLQLLEDKAVNEISAQEIAEKAQISRSTFYQHYTDIYDLLDQAEDEIFTQLSGLLQGYTYEAVKADPLRLFTELFFFFKQNSQICLVLIHKNGSITTGQRISKMIQEKFRHEWEDLLGCDSAFMAKYLSQYIISGFVGILQGWIAGGMREPVEEMAFLARLFINGTISNNFNALEVESEMSDFKDKIRSDAKGFAGGVLNDTSSLVEEKSAEIQRKVEEGLHAASGRLAQRGEQLRTGSPLSAAEAQRKIEKLQRKQAELNEKFQEKSEKLTREGKQGKLAEEREKYDKETAELSGKIQALEAKTGI